MERADKQDEVNKRLTFDGDFQGRPEFVSEGNNRGGESEESDDDDDETVFQSFEDLDNFEEEKSGERKKSWTRTLSIHQTNTQFTSLVKVNSCLTPNQAYIY